MKQHRQRFSMLALGLVLVAGFATNSAADVLTFRVEHPFAVGGQVFRPGEVSIASSPHGGHLTLSVNGERVGVLQRLESGFISAFATPQLGFLRSALGMPQLAFIRFADPRGISTRKLTLRAVAVRTGGQAASPAPVATSAGLDRIN
jgi:hypothetical protein